MNEDAIRAEGLTKYYGRTPGIIDLDFAVHPGEVFGFLGPNGAGKTTTIRTLLDLIRPTRGRASVFGLDAHADSLAVRRRVGYVPGELRLDEHLTGEELLRYYASLRGGVDERAIRSLAERLDCDLSRRIRTLSHGTRQKVALIQAVMHSPDLLVLDEPTQGLDPLMQHEFYGIVSEARRDGRTVFISSHILPEVEQLCDRVGMIREGRLIAVESVAALKERVPHRLEIRFAGPVPAAAFEGLPGIREATVEGSLLRCTVVTTPDAVVKAAAAYTVVDVVSHEPSLEDVFLGLYETGATRAA